jgi:hydrogenase 3 maturation protease
MSDLREQLQQLLQGRVCLIGLGNVDYADDGFGVRLAEELKSEIRNPKSEGNPKSETRSEGPRRTSSDFELRPSFGFQISDFGFGSQVVIAGTSPERFLGRVADEGFDHVIFLDAVEFGGAPGAVVLLNSDEMAARFPQISTHKLSLGLLARQMETNGRTKAWLLGVQPESLKPGQPLSPTVQATLELLLDLLRAGLGGRASSRAQTSSGISRNQGSRGRSPSPKPLKRSSRGNEAQLKSRKQKTESRNRQNIVMGVSPERLGGRPRTPLPAADLPNVRFRYVAARSGVRALPEISGLEVIK